ncbi:MAG TPA: hypothetical protein VKY15_08440, partial [Acidimicrobiales bacterium]|nr:hypothetical protein [Acidimicrobiales bacterium]
SGSGAGAGGSGSGGGPSGGGGSGAGGGSQVLGIDECTALVLSSPQEAGGGSCRVLGAGSVSCYRLEAASGVDPAGRVGGRAGAPALLRAWIEHAPAEIAGCLAGRQ